MTGLIDLFQQKLNNTNNYGSLNNMSKHNNINDSKSYNYTQLHTPTNKYDIIINDELNIQSNYLNDKELSDVDQIHSKSYSPIVCYAFTINYVLGIGVLSVPYAFYHSGLLLSTIVLLTVTLVAIVTANYTSDSHARAQLISAHNTAKAIQNDMMSPQPTLNYTVQTQRIEVKKQSIHTFQYNELTEFFINKTAKTIYDICIFLYMYGV